MQDDVDEGYAQGRKCWKKKLRLLGRWVTISVSSSLISWVELVNALFLCPLNGPVSPHMQLHTQTHTHTHTYTHIHAPITMMMVIWVDRCSESYCVFSVVHISNFFCFACISVHSFSQPSTSYVPAASLGVRIKYSPSTSRKESGHFRQESHEIFLSLWYVTGAQGKEGGSGS